VKNFARRIAVVSAASIAALSLASCSVSVGNPTPGGETTRAPKDSYRVAYVARAQVDSFAAWLANEMKAEAANYKDIKLDVFDGQADDEIENKMIENAIANNYDAIIVQANNGEAQRPYIEQAAAKGIVTITTNPRVENIKGASSVDAKPYDQGGIVAEYALKKIPQNAKVVVLTGPAGNFHSDQRRKAWQEKFFAARPDVKIVAENTANWNKDESLRLMEDWSLANPRIDAIISMNDNMAAGALEAVKGKPGFANILAFGVDGTPEAALLIQSGKMTATSLQNAQELAKLNIKSVHDLLSGTEETVNADIGNPLITKETSEEYVTMYKDAGLLKQ
jgi:inositol transport system substrate-binding protein